RRGGPDDHLRDGWARHRLGGVQSVLRHLQRRSRRDADPLPAGRDEDRLRGPDRGSRGALFRDLAGGHRLHPRRWRRDPAPHLRAGRAAIGLRSLDRQPGAGDRHRNLPPANRPARRRCPQRPVGECLAAGRPGDRPSRAGRTSQWDRFPTLCLHAGIRPAADRGEQHLRRAGANHRRRAGALRQHPDAPGDHSGSAHRQSDGDRRADRRWRIKRARWTGRPAAGRRRRDGVAVCCDDVAPDRSRRGGAAPGAGHVPAPTYGGSWHTL
ncbi:MAG: hypothetical protein AVDCRST_MAG18-5103, partial [uncultured Thermomicrobiales bacterium]